MNPGWRANYLRYRSYFLNVAGRYKERADIKAYIEMLLSLATISVFAVFALRPTILTIADLIKEIDTKRITIEKMQDKIDNLEGAQTLYDRERSKINVLLATIPDKPNPEVFARQIEGLSQKYSLNILEISAGEAVILGTGTVKDEKGLDPLPEGSSGLSVSMGGTTGLDRFGAILGLITDFEKLRRPAKIDSIQIKTSASKEESKFLEIYIKARLPYYRINIDQK